MIEVIWFLLPPLAMAILLVGIHAYLGLHVLRREVIFIDISLSQVAVLGGALSFLLTGEHSSVPQTLFSLGACVLIAAFLAWLHLRERQVSQEVVIGVTYASASGFLILLLDRLPHGAEHLKEALVGNILFVNWSQVLVTFLVYAFVATIHYIFREKFWSASNREIHSFLWDFLFYLLFGIVITFSTQHAGVLVVFTILVVPASLGRRFFKGTKAQLTSAWTFGLAAILVSFLLSYRLDLPAGPTIVAVLSLAFFASLIGTVLRPGTPIDQRQKGRS